MKKKSVPRKEFFQDLLLVILILCLFTVLSLSGTFDYLNWKLFDVLVVHQKSIPEYRDNVVIVCIDQKSIDFYDKQGTSWPWPREFYGHLLRYLADCDARAVFFDIIFSEQDIDRTGSSGEDSDNEFAAAIEETGIAYLAVSGQDAGDKESFHYDSRWIFEEKELFHKFHNLPSFKSALYPIPKFMHGAGGMGLVNLLPENDGIHRRYPLVSKLGDRYVPSIAFTVVKNLLDKDTFGQRVLNNIVNKSIADDEGKIFLKWYGKGGTDLEGEVDYVFTYYSYHAVMAAAIQGERGDTPIIPGDTFKDKIVIVGSNAPGLLDLKTTPFTHLNLYPGMEIHATAIENLLTADFMYCVPSWIIVLVMILSAIVLFGADKIFNNMLIYIIAYILIIIT